MYSTTIFDPDCRLCPRLAGFLCAIRQKHPHYYARPVAPFGDITARLLIIGLAPGMHGANATGRPFTGDYARILLYETLYKFGHNSHYVLPKGHHLVDSYHCSRYNVQTKWLSKEMFLDVFGTVEHLLHYD